MDKMMSFEEWIKKYDRTKGATWDDYRNAWNASRKGMIHESEAVRIPDVKDWPEENGYHAAGYALYWFPTWNTEEKQRELAVYTSDGVKLTFVKYIPSTIPSWVPNDGEPCLFDDNCRGMAGFIAGGILYARGLMVADWKTSNKVKPFSAEHIGKAWGEIPGGVE